MSRESVYDDYLEQQWDEKHQCKFIVDVPVNLTISVEGYDTDEPGDLHEKIDSAISDLCEVLYHHKNTKWFSNMERDIEYDIKVRDME